MKQLTKNHSPKYTSNSWSSIPEIKPESKEEPKPESQQEPKKEPKNKSKKEPESEPKIQKEEKKPQSESNLVPPQSEEVESYLSGIIEGEKVYNPDESYMSGLIYGNKTPIFISKESEKEEPQKEPEQEPQAGDHTEPKSKTQEEHKAQIVSENEPKPEPKIETKSEVKKENDGILEESYMSGIIKGRSESIHDFLENSIINANKIDFKRYYANEDKQNQINSLSDIFVDYSQNVQNHDIIDNIDDFNLGL